MQTREEILREIGKSKREAEYWEYQAKEIEKRRLKLEAQLN